MREKTAFLLMGEGTFLVKAFGLENGKRKREREKVGEKKVEDRKREGVSMCL